MGVTMMFHPTYSVVDLEAAREWYRAVFSRPDVRWGERYDFSMLAVDYPKDYSFFMFVGDVVLDALCPTMHATGKLAYQDRYDPSAQRPIGMGWYTDDAVATARHLASFGFRAHDQLNRLVTDDVVPVSAMADDILLFFTDPADAGMRYEFFQLGERYVPFYSQKGDPRLRPGWTRPTGPDPSDPMTIVRGSHHTILTTRPDRALRLFVDALGGVVVATAANPALDANSTYVELAGSVYEFAVPRATSPARERVPGPGDVYTGLTFLVADAVAAEKHLAHVGTPAARDVTGAVVVEHADGFGVQWRFAEQTPYPEEPRSRESHSQESQ